MCQLAWIILTILCVYISHAPCKYSFRALQFSSGCELSTEYEDCEGKTTYLLKDKGESKRQFTVCMYYNIQPIIYNYQVAHNITYSIIFLYSAYADHCYIYLVSTGTGEPPSQSDADKICPQYHANLTLARAYSLADWEQLFTYLYT